MSSRGHCVAQTTPRWILGDDAERRIADLRNGTGKDIWLCGGGELFRRLLAVRLVDTIELGVSPGLFGRAGASMLPADPPLPRTVRLELTRHVALPTGLLVLEYAIQHGTA